MGRRATQFLRKRQGSDLPVAVVFSAVLLGLLLVGGGAWLWLGTWAGLVAGALYLLLFGDVALAAWVNARRPKAHASAALHGQRGVVLDTHQSAGAHWQGRIKVRGEIWQAQGHRIAPEPGTPVRVVELQGLQLRVIPYE